MKLCIRMHAAVKTHFKRMDFVIVKCMLPIFVFTCRFPFHAGLS